MTLLYNRCVWSSSSIFFKFFFCCRSVKPIVEHLQYNFFSLRFVCQATAVAVVFENSQKDSKEILDKWDSYYDMIMNYWFSACYVNDFKLSILVWWKRKHDKFVLLYGLSVFVSHANLLIQRLSICHVNYSDSSRHSLTFSLTHSNSIKYFDQNMKKNVLVKRQTKRKGKITISEALLRSSEIILWLLSKNRKKTLPYFWPYFIRLTYHFLHNSVHKQLIC